jgi:hypothetical protein
MRNIFSLIACAVICIVLVQYRVSNSGIVTGRPLKITEWDAFGYYMYLPAIVIYHDYKELKWIPEIDRKYGLTGGGGYPAEKTGSGNYAFKYLGGVAIMEIPFFLAGHLVAKYTGYPPDGFSQPYQYALAFGVLLYCMLAILLLRKILLCYYSDLTTAVTLLLVCLASNFIVYAAVDSGQSHAYIFVLYALVLITTLKWHRQPNLALAALTGYTIGLATMSRPTEAIMLFIPLMWNTHTKTAAAEKWRMVRQHRSHIAAAVFFGLLGILPQLIYWKLATGSFIYDVGSKWEFLNPHFRVLFGWEKGWFIYTPVTVFFIVGFFFMKQFQFRKSVLWFCLLNIYIIIAWHDWRYGGSYSTRALVQSYPVFALPLGAFVEKMRWGKWRFFFYPLFVYLLLVNLFQVTQYCKTILHYDQMNRLYYGRIYLNPNPSPTDMSLLDNDEVLNDEAAYKKTRILKTGTPVHVNFPASSSAILFEAALPNSKPGATKSRWLKIESRIKAPDCLWQSFLNADLQSGDSIKHARVRLFSPISRNAETNSYVFYVTIPGYFEHGHLKVYLGSAFNFEGVVEGIEITELER